jgi:hypothetical protein
MSNAATFTVRIRDLAPGQIMVHPSRPDTVFDPPPGATVTLGAYLTRVDHFEANDPAAPTVWYREIGQFTGGPWGCIFESLDDTVEVLA